MAIKANKASLLKSEYDQGEHNCPCAGSSC